jgi:FkbH-like protein
MMELKYIDLLKINKELGYSLKLNSYDITVISNIIVQQSKEIIEYTLRSEGVNANVNIGDYDNIIQDSKKYNNSNVVFIIWELCNIIDGFQYKVELLNDKQFDEILNNVYSEINLVLKNIENTTLVLFNTFSSRSFSFSTINKNNLDKLAVQLNCFMEEISQVNVKLIDIDKITATIGIANSFDFRYYYSSKALYTVEFFKAYAEYVKPFIMSANGKSKKALIFDCDNTLWQGVLGEDGFDNIEMSTNTKNGGVFAEIQAIALSLNKQGILICLCSKNNPEDVNEVITSHPDMQLREESITIKKVNWLDKVSNLQDISTELNIGLDSMVFVDDSSFEVNLIREQLPEVKVLQVPDKLYEYPMMLRKNLKIFYNFSLTSEDRNKIEMYKHQVIRESVKNEFTDVNTYLASLELKITIFENDDSIIARMSQMTQKTNQFNLTTKRYTEKDIQNYIDNPKSDVFAISVADKYGDYGITGLCIITGIGITLPEIDTLQMSCRVIGRNVEFVFMDYIINKMKKKELKKINAKYIKTPKNQQVENFYKTCSFSLGKKTKSVKNYTLELNDYEPTQVGYIEVVNAK